MVRVRHFEPATLLYSIVLIGLGTLVAAQKAPPRGYGNTTVRHSRSR